ncbi:MAG: hypothetical protein AABX89_03905 [Candidatus Thermoplasmatota archaeon]
MVRLHGGDLMVLGQLGTEFRACEAPTVDPHWWAKRMARQGIIRKASSSTWLVQTPQLLVAAKLAVEAGLDLQGLFPTWPALPVFATLPFYRNTPKAFEVANLAPATFYATLGKLNRSGTMVKHDGSYCSTLPNEADQVVQAYRAIIACQEPNGIHQSGREAAWLAGELPADWHESLPVANDGRASIRYAGRRQLDDLDKLLLSARSALGLAWTQTATEPRIDIVRRIAERLDLNILGTPVNERFGFYGLTVMWEPVVDMLLNEPAGTSANRSRIISCQGPQTVAGKNQLERVRDYSRRHYRKKRAHAL